ncbi:hypothetical protein A3C23_03470 [Candidatus Roizmanbacteria bacterium RIFCSPHIGHO2_02_FULL_37_13b]|nr:MAG: hypothetical protein A3C23_03470 [Candidatus Roizmanbacteria bacterium RIFCSPHIGHO2_02_FULL_37_13b]
MKFTYKALKNNVLIKANIEADNKQKLIEYLKAKNYLIVDIFEHKNLFNEMQNKYFASVGHSDIVDFTRQLAIMFNAGLTIIDALDILKKQTTNPAMLRLINSLDDSIRAGNSLSLAMSQYPHHFNNLYIALVKSGEASGKLDEILVRLADQLEKQRTFKAKIKGALIYPVIIIIGMIGVIFVMITFVIPKLLELYKDFDIDLPITTKILIVISSFFQRAWPLVIIIIFGAVVLTKRILHTKRGKKLFDRLILKIPLFNKIIKMSALVDTTRTLSILMKSGVSIIEALSIAVETSSNLVFQDAFATIKNRVEKGDSLGKSMGQLELFPPILVQMTTVGEQTGHLDEVLFKMSVFFEMESELAIKALTTMIEPVILVVLAIGVGFIVFSVITPIYNLTNAF